MGKLKYKKNANQFWIGFFRQKLLLILLAQLGIAILACIIFIITDNDLGSSLSFWLSLSIILLTSLTVNLLIFFNCVYPTKQLLAAIIEISGEKTNLTPPNPKDERYLRNGLSDALETIYNLSAENCRVTETKESTNSSQLANITGALNATKCGFIALDSNRRVVYANRTSPVHIDTDGNQVINLIFNGKDNLNNWLDECSEHAVQADRTWTRVPDRLPNQEDRRFFDVLASYQKGANIETTLVLVDRTGTYAGDEEDLDFISFAAHELRGPITVIKGYADVLQNELSDKLQNDQVELFHRLSISASRLSGYIDNILNTSRYDRRHLKVVLAEDTVANVYDIIRDDMQLRASAQHRLLSVNLPADLPTVAVDRASMSEVFGNLIDNAIKYSNEGGAINVTAKVNGDFVDFSVQDSGIGMPENVVANLFQKFYRSYRSRETIAGTGIGLYISKAIVESHGGNISVRSQDGHGSTFTVSIPIYSTVADKLKARDNSNEGLIREGNGWIKNHSMYRG